MTVGRVVGGRVRVRWSGREEGVLDSLEGDLLLLKLERRLNQPAGRWGLTLTARRDSRGRRYHHRIRPMDYVELYLSRDRQQLPATPTLRGFVDGCYEEYRADGARVQHAVTVNGRDLVSVYLLHKYLYFLKLIDPVASAVQFPGVLLQSAADLFAVPNLTPQEFLDKVKALVLDGQLGPRLGAQTAAGLTVTVGGVPDLRLRAGPGMERFAVTLLSAAQIEGPVWNLLRHYQGAPFCELVLHDPPEGPELLWRWAPYRGPLGEELSPAQDVPTHLVGADELLQLAIGTSQQGVVNYFLVYPRVIQALSLDPKILILGERGMTQDARNPCFLRELADRYGFRPLEIPLPLFPQQAVDPTQQQQQTFFTRSRELAEDLAQWCGRAFGHQALLEEGTAVLQGRPEIAPGSYVQLRETGQTFYVEAVTHEWQLTPPRFLTTLELRRGYWPPDRNPYPPEVAGQRQTLQTLPRLEGG